MLASVFFPIGIDNAVVAPDQVLIARGGLPARPGVREVNLEILHAGVLDAKLVELLQVALLLLVGKADALIEQRDVHGLGQDVVECPANGALTLGARPIPEHPAGGHDAVVAVGLQCGLVQNVLGKVGGLDVAVGPDAEHALIGVDLAAGKGDTVVHELHVLVSDLDDLTGREVDGCLVGTVHARGARRAVRALGHGSVVELQRAAGVVLACAETIGAVHVELKVVGEGEERSGRDRPLHMPKLPAEQGARMGALAQLDRGVLPVAGKASAAVNSGHLTGCVRRFDR